MKTLSNFNYATPNLYQETENYSDLFFTVSSANTPEEGNDSLKYYYDSQNDLFPPSFPMLGTKLEFEFQTDLKDHPYENHSKEVPILEIACNYTNKTELIHSSLQKSSPKRTKAKISVSNTYDMTSNPSDKSSGKENTNIVKNYIPITSNAFAHFMLEDQSPEVQDIIYSSVRAYCDLAQFNALRETVLEYIKKKIFGKKNHTNQDKTNTSRQYKIRSKLQMTEVFHGNEKDSEKISLVKTILRNMMGKFLDSRVYGEWLETSYNPKSEINKKFLSDPYNREQIKNVYTCFKFRPAFR
jgi:hypothetical protein